MTKKDKEEERLERTIRGLLKLPENRRCINCNSLGPQYVCTTFWTFVCTSCSGVHREFTHRVKSVSMAKFNAEEVAALQAGGNERTRQIYFKEWDQHRHSFPDISNINGLREFVKSVYVDRKYTGDRNQERPSRLRPNDRQESFDARKLGAFRSGSQSSNFEDRHERIERISGPPSDRTDERTLKYYFEERNSPRSVKESPRHGSLRRNTPRFEIVDDRFRDDDSRSNRVFDSCRLSRRESRHGSRSPDPQSNTAQPASPAVRTLKQIVGEKSKPLQVEEKSKEIRGEGVNVSGNDKVSAPSIAEKPAASTPADPKTQPENSLIVFNTEPNPTGGAAAVPKSNGGNIPSQSLTPPAPQRNTVEFLMFELAAPFVEPAGLKSKVPKNDISSFVAPERNIPMLETKPSVKMPTASTGYGVHTTIYADSEQSNGASLSAPPEQMLALTYGFDALEQAVGTNYPSGQQIPLNPLARQMSALTDYSRTSTMPHGTQRLPRCASSAPDMQSVPDTGISSPMFSTSQPAAAPVNNTLLDSFDSPLPSSTTNFPSQNSYENLQASPLSRSGSISQVLGGQPFDFSAAYGISEGKHGATRFGAQDKQPSASWNDTNVQGIYSAQVGRSPKEGSKVGQDAAVQLQTGTPGRQELPQDLFVGYLPASRPVPGWPTGPSNAAGFGMQYHPTAMPGMAYGSQPRSFNPFDFCNESTPPQASQFPSMDNFHGALPDSAALGMALHTAGGHSVSSGLMRPQAASAMLPQSTPYTSSFASGGYPGQQTYMNMPHSSPQGPGEFSSDGASSFDSFNMSQQLNSGYPPQGPAYGGNPFG